MPLCFGLPHGSRAIRRGSIELRCFLIKLSVVPSFALHFSGKPQILPAHDYVASATIVSISTKLSMADIKSSVVDTGNRLPDSPKLGEARNLDPIDELFEAIQNNNTDKMRRIIKKNRYVLNKQNDPGKTENTLRPQQLLAAEALGNLMTQDVLRYRQDKSITVDEYGKQCPLHVACLFGGLDTVKILLEQTEIVVNVQNGAKESPLGIACRAANLDIATLLVKKFSETIEVHHADDVGNTPISYLAGRGIYPLWSEDPSHDKLKALVPAMLRASGSEEYGRLCLEEACREGNIPLLQVLVNSAKNSINKGDTDGWTPLHFAILYGEGEAVRILLDHGADPGTGAKESDLMQPLQLALTFGAETIADMIREKLLTKLLENPRSSLQHSSHVDPLDYFMAQTWRGNTKPTKPANEESNDEPKIEMKGEANDAPDNELNRQLDESPKKPEGYIESVPMRDVLGNPQMTSLERDHTATKMKWYHLPANNWHWAKHTDDYGQDLCLKCLGDEADDTFKEVMKCFQATFESTGQVPPLCEHSYTEIKDVNWSSRGQSNISEKAIEERQPRNMLIVLPVIDVDYLAGFQKVEHGQQSPDFSQLVNMSPNKKHIPGMRALYGQENKGEYKGQQGAVHYPRTLDHYYHTDLSEGQQSQLNKEQVFTRYLKAQASKPTERSQRQSSDTMGPRFSLSWPLHLFNTPTNRPDARNHIGIQPDVERQECVQEDHSGQPKKPSLTLSSAEERESPHSILVVSQLWIIKLDSE
ncbi:hypothetical protein CPAR01_11085 [Colletotrichum paranaense]|uniref:Ankyrin repeat protein n=1 Tax=Colletotrichum paranaense TaxID=1914294 RepID=A0ABQ9SAL5_9PEZI|nr:uncharacterized protein CPAR01_11085 [Colletotrichum paranaense]KAK1531436.1 hypothetical protein CPAR01_11085 [Colletotrichum paranaense]